MKNYDELWGLAEDNFGLVTVEDAKGLGVPNSHLVMMAKRGVLEHIGRGVYQVKHHVPGPNDSYAIAVAKVGPDAYLRGASVLGMLKLVATDLSVVYVGCGKRTRRKLPEYIVLKGPARTPTLSIEGIMSEPVSEALVSARFDGSLDEDKLEDAADAAFDRGLITEIELNSFKKECSHE